MAAALLPDRLWNLVEPFLPILARRPQGGRPRVSDRACLTGIVFVLRSGIPWQMLPQELGCGSGMTWRRLRDWQRAGVSDLMHFALLDWLARSDQIDWSRAVVDSCSVRAVCGGDQTGPNPTAIRSGLRTRGILPLLAMHRTKHGSGLGTWRWVVERTFAWLNQVRRLRVRYDKRADIHEAFLSLGCALARFLDVCSALVLGT
jgi:transposase